MTKFFNKFKNLVFSPFLPIFLILGAKIFFLENPSLSRTTSNRFLAPCQNLEKTNNIIPKKTPGQTEERMARWIQGRKDGHTIFHRTLPATTGGPKNKVPSVISFLKELYKQKIYSIWKPYKVNEHYTPRKLCLCLSCLLVLLHPCFYQDAYQEME